MLPASKRRARRSRLAIASCSECKARGRPARAVLSCGALRALLRIRAEPREETMKDQRFSRRDVLKASTAAVAAGVFASPVKAAPPEASAITPALIEAARKEGKVTFY